MLSKGPSLLTIHELVTKCREESAQLAQEPADGLSACWELFRLAIVEDNQQAWQALYVQYRRLVGKWGAGTELDLDDLVTETFARFWQGVRGQDFASRFPTMKAVMSYLKRCAKARAIDAARRREYQQRIREALAAAGHEADDPLEDKVLKKIFGQELLIHLHSRLQDEDEQLVFRLSYELGLKPAEIARQYPQRFPEVQAVYRIKERIVSRLANDPTLQRWQGP
jgi:RNA polymerase sigma factor (sigma-70 family)